MNLLFEECKVALGENIVIIDNQKQEQLILNILNRYLTEFNTVDLNILSYSDYSSAKILLEKQDKFLNDIVYVVADTSAVPIFESNLRSVLENIDDVTALSSKTFIFNKKFMLQEVFPTSTLRFSLALDW